MGAKARFLLLFAPTVKGGINMIELTIDNNAVDSGLKARSAAQRHFSTAIELTVQPFDCTQGPCTITSPQGLSFLEKLHFRLWLQW